MKFTPWALLAIQLIGTQVNGFTVQSSTRTTPTTLYVQKQTRSSLLTPPVNKSAPVPSSSKPKQEKEENEEVFGAKFFGGSAIKDELLDDTIEEQADKLSKLYPPAAKKENEVDDEVERPTSYNRFMDPDAFDDASRSLAQRLQTAINQALYMAEDGNGSVGSVSVYSPTLQWNTPLSKDASSKTPLDELTNALDFYKRIDVAIVGAKCSNGNGGNNNAGVQSMDVKWEISVIWPNVFESRVLITGSSTLTVDMTEQMILSQTDKLDNGGTDGTDTIKAIYNQVQPRFWDLYHVAMTPSAETMTRCVPSAKSGGGGSSGPLSNYNVFEIPSRLVFQPSMEDLGGRDARTAQALPNHAFSSLIKTTGPKAQRYVTTTPVEVNIRRNKDDKSVITWNVALPPEFVSYCDELPLGSRGSDDVDGGDDNQLTEEGAECTYAYQPRRLVATMPFGGLAQDVEVSDVRKALYERVMKDGWKPKLDGKRPQFFFLNNDAKACFTGNEGLGMAVYEWRPELSNSNEVGIELEL